MSTAIIRADARCLPLPDESVDLVVTSPPYWQLRAYSDGGSAYEGQIGAEPTPQEYIAALLDCTREWVRVLKPEGSLWVNVGDKYAGSAGWATSDGTSSSLVGTHHKVLRRQGKPSVPHTSVPAKSLIGLPWRYALGCIDDLGLILRAEVIWAKPNGMPESVTDRVRRSHEQWFHLVKQPRYFADVDAIREPLAAPNRIAGRSAFKARDASHRRTATGPYEGPSPLGALPRSVWEVATQPLKASDHLAVDHFAAFPPALIDRIILGWSPPGICTECGEGRRPAADRGRLPDRPGRVQGRDRDALLGGHGADGRAGNRYRASIILTGYACACPTPDAPTRPAIVLDPFGGTGTTALVASMHGRHSISADLSHDYGRLARWRTTDPGERARALGLPKPPPVPDGQDSLFEEIA